MNGEMDKEMEKVLRWAKRYSSPIKVHKENPTYCHVVNQPGLEHYISVEKVHRLEEMGYLKSTDGNGSAKAWELSEKGHEAAVKLIEKHPEDFGPF